MYFQDGGRRAGSLDEVRFTDIEHLAFEPQPGSSPKRPDYIDPHDDKRLAPAYSYRGADEA
ncbi:hypothetical protein ACFQ9J_26920 [Streptomyces sp. NPDC056529]|uniref:hypothetical protein n=1 Tax=Streptomyces sp. NPDC056529 TaxID=3345855 RepID=UPI0036B5DBE9